MGSSLQHGEFEFRNKSGKFGRDRVRLESKYFIIEYERVFEPIISDYYRSRPKSTEDSFVRAQNLNSESFEKNDNYSNCFCNDRIENWTNRVRLLSKVSRWQRKHKRRSLKSHLIPFEFFRNLFRILIFDILHASNLDLIFRDPCIWYSMHNDSIVRCNCRYDYLKSCKIWTRERESFSSQPMESFPPCRWNRSRKHPLQSVRSDLDVTRNPGYRSQWVLFYFSVPSFAWNTRIIWTERGYVY